MTVRSLNKKQLVLSCIAFCIFLTLSVFAQTDPDPNSPPPVLFTEDSSPRVLSSLSFPRGKRAAAPKGETQILSPGGEGRIYISGIELMADEGANAFRIYGEDKNGHIFRFPVAGLNQVFGKQRIYELTFKLSDELGFWGEPEANTDLIVWVTWRGLSSNRGLLANGATGGNEEKAAELKPSPIGTTAKTEESNDPNYIGYRWSGDRIRFLEQATFGPTTAEDSRLRRIGLRTWLAEQFAKPYPSAFPYPNFPQVSSNSNIGCPQTAGTPEKAACDRDHYSMYPVQKWFFQEAFYGDAQLRHRVAWALSQILVTSGVSIQQSRHMVEYQKILSNNAFGNYRQLLKEVTLSPAMGDYLDMAQSTRTNPNENYARELLQLFSVGLFALNPDGTVQTSGGVPIDTYNQNTVNAFTKVLTGWSFCNTGCTNSAAGIVNFIDPMALNQTRHDVTAKTLLQYPGAVNVNIAANLNGSTEIELALDNVFNHPNVGPFVSKQLIQHLVTSDPSPAYVQRVVAKFNNNGSGVRGDLKAVIRQILLDPEARGDVKTDPNYGKLREPVQYVTNMARHFNVGSANLSTVSDGVVANLPSGMLQNPFYSPTVFNYYPPNYVIPGTSLLAPEFGIMTTGTSISRLNVINTLVYSNLSVSPPNRPNGTALNFSELTALASADPTGNRLLDVLNQRMMHGTMSAQMRSTILPAFTAVPSTTPAARAQAALYLVATSSQYQIQR